MARTVALVHRPAAGAAPAVRTVAFKLGREEMEGNRVCPGIKVRELLAEPAVLVMVQEASATAVAAPAVAARLVAVVVVVESAVAAVVVVAVVVLVLVLV